MAEVQMNSFKYRQPSMTNGVHDILFY